MTKAPTTIKRFIVGRPMSSGELEHTLLPKVIALPVFASDALSSVAYATQEMLLVVGLAGAAALSRLTPISMAVALLLAIVVISYRQTIVAYPSGGGAYIVARENLGQFSGLMAAGSLLIDYVLTVSVSIVAGVDAIVSAAPGLLRYDIQLAILFVTLVTLANLRGVRESGIAFAIPTYGFVICIYLLLATGFVKCLGGCPLAESADEPLKAVQMLTPFLIARTFAAGTTALTGVEAVSNGVTAFRYPQSRNANTTLAIMGTMSITMFLGISWLAQHTQVHHTHHSNQTVVAEIAQAIFGRGPIFYIIQVMTAFVLFLAANTAFAGFPRLASILAKDRFMPRQFMNLGDRLVFSNGIIILATLAALLIVAFDADLNRLIQLYLVGVFLSFTLSQAGMIVHWRKTRKPKWRGRLSINAFGALMTAVVLVIVIVTKFQRGAWIVIASLPVIIYLMVSIHRHYMDLEGQLEEPARLPSDRRPGNQHLVILVNRVDAATSRAVGYARAVAAADITAVTFDSTTSEAWHRLAPEMPLQALSPTGAKWSSLRRFLRERRETLASDDFLTVIVPEVLKSRSLFEIFRRPTLHRLKGKLVRETGVQVLDIPLLKSDIDPDVDQAHEPARNHVCVLVRAVNNASLQAIEYAETLQPTDIRGVTFGLDPEETEALGDEWIGSGIPHPLEIEDSPFRDIGSSLLAYVRQFAPDGINRVVTVVIPEFVVSKRRHQLLHGNTALLVKRHLLFEPGVVAVSVPYHLEES